MSRAVRPSDWESWTQAREVVRVKCKPCNGKGVISNSCRCHGKGKVLDKAESDRQGVPVMKACDRCGGRGYARLKFSTVIEGVNTVAEIKKTAAYEQLQPLFEELVAECHKQEYCISRKNWIDSSLTLGIRSVVPKPKKFKPEVNALGFFYFFVA
eukprot:gene29541-36218_t